MGATRDALRLYAFSWRALVSATSFWALFRFVSLLRSKPDPLTKRVRCGQFPLPRAKESPVQPVLEELPYPITKVVSFDPTTPLSPLQLSRGGWAAVGTGRANPLLRSGLTATVPGSTD